MSMPDQNKRSIIKGGTLRHAPKKRSRKAGLGSWAGPFGGLVIFVVAVAGLFIGLAKLNPASDNPTVLTGEQPLVVATVPHIAIWTKQLVGPGVRVQSLVTGGVDVHDFSFKPADLALVSRATLVVANGAGLEPWLPSLEQKFPDKTFVRAAQGLPLKKNDPHVWLDPVLAARQVENISNVLSATFPELDGVIKKNTAAYMASLQELDRQIQDTLDDLAPSQKNFIVFHDAFNYLADRYGLRQAAQLVERPGDQLTLREIQNVGQTTRRLGIRVLFVEPGPVPDLAQSLADQFNLRLIVLDPLEVIPPEPGTYLAGMRKNLQALVQGLSAAESSK